MALLAPALLLSGGSSLAEPGSGEPSGQDTAPSSLPADAASEGEAAQQSARRWRWDPSWEEGLIWRTLDERINLRVGAYIMFDWADIGQSSALDPLGTPDPEDGEVRDFQINFRGRLYRNTEIILQYDIDDGEFELKDNYFMWENVPRIGTIQLGHVKEPFGLEHLNSLRHIPFMERSLADALTPSRGLGVMARNTAREGRLAWSLGAFYETDTVDNISDSQAFALTGRLSGLPIYRDEGDELLHVGIGVTHRILDKPMRIEVRPEANLAPRYLDTDKFSADELTGLNVEAAYLRGPLQLQSECVWARTSGAVYKEDATLNDVADELAARYPRLVEWLSGKTDWERPTDSILWSIPFDIAAHGELEFFGVYAQAAYVLTGETRLYNQSRGLFGPVIPENPVRFRAMRGTGAWEVAARISHIDLNDRYVHGGRETNFTLGVNWYLNKYARFTVNYVHGEIDRDAYDGSFDAIQTRLQLDFQTQALSDYHPVRRLRRQSE